VTCWQGEPRQSRQSDRALAGFRGQSGVRARGLDKARQQVARFFARGEQGGISYAAASRLAAALTRSAPGHPTSRRRRRAVISSATATWASLSRLRRPGSQHKPLDGSPRARSEERVSRSAWPPRFRVPAAILVVALALPAPGGYVHLHLSLAPPMSGGAQMGASSDPSTPHLTCDPTEPPEAFLAADQEEYTPTGTAETRAVPRGASRTARRSRRIRAAVRAKAPAQRLRRRRGRASMSRGDPDSEDAGPGAFGARVARAGRLRLDAATRRSSNTQPIQTQTPRPPSVRTLPSVDRTGALNFGIAPRATPPEGR
jgi:hypothetical protein